MVLAAAGLRAKRGDFDMAARDIASVFEARDSLRINPALGRAIAEFVEAGGSPDAVAPIAAAFAQDTPRSREAHLWHTRYLRFTGQHKAALMVHDRFMGEDEFSAHAYFERGQVRELMGKHALARSAYKRAIALNPNLPRAARALRDLSVKHPVWALKTRVMDKLLGQRRG